MDLDRFRKAQERVDDGFSTALAELEAGQKRSHWIWYIFPQLAGLGRSPMAVAYGLRGLREATDYLRDPLLRTRLFDVTHAVVRQLTRPSPPTVAGLMGSEIDALKLVSSLTLFRGVAQQLGRLEPCPGCEQFANEADRILTVASAEGFAECAMTLRRLTSGDDE